MVEARNCTARGFMNEAPDVDHCFPPSVLYYNENPLDLGVLELEMDAMAAYDREHGLRNFTANSIVSCNCLWGSEVRDGLAEYSTAIPAPYRLPYDGEGRTAECADLLAAYSPFESQEMVRRAETQLNPAVSIAGAPTAITASSKKR